MGYLDDKGLEYFWGLIKRLKQDTLTSGTNIKTVNGNSILGSGDLSVTGDCIAYPSFEIDSNGHLIMEGGDPRLFELVNGHLIYNYNK
jgi:hypothetical protein